MIGTTLGYVRKRLDAHLRSVFARDSDGISADRVVFLEGDKLDPFTLQARTIGMVVVNVQEEREFRDANRHQRSSADSSGLELHHPDIHLELSVLFVAKFKDYDYAWDQLSHVIAYFQANPVLDAETASDLPPGLKRLVSELGSPSYQQQSEIWSALRASLHPSLLYRFQLISFQGPPLRRQPAPIKFVDTRLQAQSHLRAPPWKPGLPHS
jgi:hypothetical protein